MKTRSRLVLDILVTAAVLITAIAGCANSDTEETDISPSDISVSDMSETEVTTTETSETTKETETQYEPDPTYEEAAAYVKQLLAEGNTAEEVIDILVSEGRTEFDATALVNSVILQCETVPDNSDSSTSTGSNSGSSSSSSSTSQSTGTGSTSNQNTSTSTTELAQETSPTATTQTTGSGQSSSTTSATPTPTTEPTSTPIPTQVIQTVYMRIIWDDDSIEAMAAQGIDLNAERPEAVGTAIYACDENGNYNAGMLIDSSDVDAARDQMYAEADAIIAKYNISGAVYSYTAYKKINEYVYD